MNNVGDIVDALDRARESTMEFKYQAHHAEQRVALTTRGDGHVLLSIPY
jgi:hypothetical protein